MQIKLNSTTVAVKGTTDKFSRINHTEIQNRDRLHYQQENQKYLNQLIK